MLYESHIGNFPQFIDQKSINNEKYLQTITFLHTLPKSAKKVQCTGAIAPLKKYFREWVAPMSLASDEKSHV